MGALDGVMAELRHQDEQVPWQPAQGEGQHHGDEDTVGALAAACVVLLDGAVPQHETDVFVEERREADGQHELEEEDGH